MVLLNGVIVTIQVHGQPLEEFIDEDNQAAGLDTSYRYIPSKVGEPFSLYIDASKTTFHEKFSGFSCKYWVNGIQISKFFVSDGSRSNCTIAGPKQCVDGAWSVQQLHFTDLQIS